ncbi:MAG: preprotein translocase subunit SecB, partial [Candidatus Azotimanducaceae bacterium]
SEQEPATIEQTGAQFALQRIFVKDASFESPRAPEIFRAKWQPKVNMELNSSHNKIEEDLYEVVIQLTITARSENDEVVYLTEVQQAGIFLVKGLEPEALLQTLGAFCPSVLFPYAREAVDNLVIKGSFPPLMLAPVNFDAIYEQTRRQQQEATH